MDAHDRLIVEASFNEGTHVQKGLLVVRSVFATFLPLDSKASPLVPMSRGGAVATTALVVHAGHDEGASAASYLESIGELSTPEHDLQLWHAARIARWWVAEPRRATLLCEKVPLYDRYRLWIGRGDQGVGAVFGVPGHRIRAREHVLAPWAMG